VFRSVFFYQNFTLEKNNLYYKWDLGGITLHNLILLAPSHGKCDKSYHKVWQKVEFTLSLSSLQIKKDSGKKKECLVVKLLSVFCWTNKIKEDIYIVLMQGLSLNLLFKKKMLLLI
jgi:hypothetical protein